VLASNDYSIAEARDLVAPLIAQGAAEAKDGALRSVWHSRFGDVLVEVRDSCSFVNGQRVDPVMVEEHPPP
jgi:hypothetical protein